MDKKMQQGYIQLYTGDGKGKTTAALGLTLRASGAGLKVYIAQFMKSGDYSEIKALKKMSATVRIEQFGTGKFVKGKPLPEDLDAARTGLVQVEQVIHSGDYDIVILEEGNTAVMCGVLYEKDILRIFDSKPADLELVITGRGATPKMIQKADLVTEMKAVKHYYRDGVTARVGIEK